MEFLQDEIDDLASFREKWQNELKVSTQAGNNQSVENHSDNEDKESKAKHFFIKGIEMEKAGKMYEAIQFYRKAVQIVPDIEFKVDVAPKSKPKEALVELNEDGK